MMRDFHRVFFLCFYVFLVIVDVTSYESLAFQKYVKDDISEEKREYCRSINSEIYIVKIEGVEYIAKHVHKSRRSGFEDELKSSYFLAKHRLGPQIYYVDHDKLIIIMEYIKPDPITSNDRKSDVFYRELALCMREFHKSEPEKWMREVDLISYTKLLIKSLLDTHKFNHSSYLFIKKIQNFINNKQWPRNIEKNCCISTYTPITCSGKVVGFI